jgi:hypothetical protein
MEHWQEQDPLAIFKKLLIVSYASLLVWRVENASDKNSEAMKNFLIKLSGRYFKKGKSSLSPALLAGLWYFLQLSSVLNTYDVSELLSMKDKLSTLAGFEF